MFARISSLLRSPAARWRAAVTAAVLLGVLTALGAGFWGQIQLAEVRAELSTQRREVARLDAQLREREALIAELAALRALAQVAQDLQVDRYRTVVLMNELARRTPTGVQITGLRQAQQQARQESLQTVTVQGVALSPDHVSRILRAFAAAPGFTPPELVEATAAGFTLRFGVQP